MGRGVLAALSPMNFVENRVKADVFSTKPLWRCLESILGKAENTVTGLWRASTIHQLARLVRLSGGLGDDSENYDEVGAGGDDGFAQ